MSTTKPLADRPKASYIRYLLLLTIAIAAADAVFIFLVSYEAKFSLKDLAFAVGGTVGVASAILISYSCSCWSGRLETG